MIELVLTFLTHLLCTVLAFYILGESIDALCKMPGGWTPFFPKVKYLVAGAVAFWTVIRVFDAAKAWIDLHEWTIQFTALHLFYLLVISIFIWPRTLYRFRAMGLIA